MSNAIVCQGGPVYEYGGILIELHPAGTMILNKRTLDPRNGTKREWGIVDHFMAVNDREEYRRCDIPSGCVVLGKEADNA